MMGGDTVRAFREASAAIGHPPYRDCRPVITLPQLASQLQAPNLTPSPVMAKEPGRPWQTAMRMCQATVSATVATPLRTAVTSGLVLYSVAGVAPTLGLAGLLSTLHVLAPYCAAAGFMHWLTDRSQDSAVRLRGQRAALGAVCLPAGGILGTIAGATAGLTGAGLLVTAAGGAAAFAGAAYLAHEALRSPLGLCALLIGLLCLLTRFVVPHL